MYYTNDIMIHYRPQNLRRTCLGKARQELPRHRSQGDILRGRTHRWEIPKNWVSDMDQIYHLDLWEMSGFEPNKKDLSINT